MFDQKLIMMMRAFSLLCLLCMAQAAAATFSDPQASIVSDNINATASMSPPSSTATPLPDSASDSEDENKGLKEGGANLLGITVFLIFLIVVGVAYSYIYPPEQGGENAPPDRRTRFFDSLGLWHRAFFDLMKACIPTKGMRVSCYILAPLPIVLGVSGMFRASGTLFGVAVLFLFILAAFLADPERCEALEVQYEELSVLFLVAPVVLSFLAPAVYTDGDNDHESNAALVLLSLLVLFLAWKVLHTVRFLRIKHGYNTLF